MADEIYIQGDSVVCGLGQGSGEVAVALFANELPALCLRPLTDGRRMPVCSVALEPGDLFRPSGRPETRNNHLARLALDLLPDTARAVIADTPPERLGVAIGTSTSGISAGEVAMTRFLQDGRWPEDFDLTQQELGDPALFLASLLDARGPAYAISTACTSGAKAIISGARLIQQGICDTVVCGGVDTLCDMTLNGFGVLEALSRERCNPFSQNRSGIHIGEAAALLVLTADRAQIRVAGWGESSDAHHISAPDPGGHGAKQAMRAALRMAGKATEDIGYINLHGTATQQNDRMEAAAVHELFGNAVACSSTKPLTGHTLGAAGAVEAVILALSLRQGRIPRNLNDGVVDPEIAGINLLQTDEDLRGRFAMSCNYAFGGNNTALILEAT